MYYLLSTITKTNLSPFEKTFEKIFLVIVTTNLKVNIK